MDRITACRDYLLNLRRTKTRVAALPGHIVPQSLAEGYAVQERVVSVLLAEVGRQADRLQDRLHERTGPEGTRRGWPVLRRADVGHHVRERRDAQGGSTIIVRCAEAEFGFEMADDVPDGPDLHAGVDQGVHRRGDPVDRDRRSPLRRTGRWSGRPSLLADNAIHGAWVAGEPYAKLAGPRLRARTPPRSSSTASARLPGSGRRGAGQPAHGGRVAGERAAASSAAPSSRATGSRPGVTTDIYLAQPGDHLAADFGVDGEGGDELRVG